MVFHHNVVEYMEANPDVKAKWEDISQNVKPTEWAKELAQILPDFFVR